MKNKKEIKSDSNVDQKSTILGTFEGECADSTITNKNGLDITREVWENVFASEEYKKAIELGHYIGFLGHPEDPNCMDFEHACIVMREGHIEDNGKIYGSFDLIDTPVGKIVKAFQDAGVQFGISVRGAGDIIDNSVDPETFVFRGFDLVSFPAYPDAIPKFTEIAASTDVKDQQKYKTICAAVKENIDSLNTCEAVDIIQSQFAKQSEEYSLLQNKKNAIKSSAEPVINIDKEKIEALTQLYLEAKNKIECLTEENKKLRIAASSTVETADRKIDSLKRIQSDQIKNYKACLADAESKQKSADHKKVLSAVNIRKLKEDLRSKEKECEDLKAKNLKYKRKVESADQTIRQRDDIISNLSSQLDETVVSSEKLETKATNLAVKVKNLESKIEASQKIIQDYQDAYGNMYATALGVHIDNMSITAGTSVNDLQSIIRKSASKDNLSNTLNKDYSSDEVYVDSLKDNDIVTL